MKTLNLSFAFICFLVSFQSSAQDNDFNKEVNQSIWEKFTLAYENLDTSLYSSLHSEEFIRVSGDTKTIRDKKTYMDGYGNWWQDKNLKLTISFRFLERINNGETASERGIYKLTVNHNTEKEASYYGAFHVILRKENSLWKLLVDYDSNPNDSIGEEAYLKAQPQE